MTSLSFSGNDSIFLAIVVTLLSLPSTTTISTNQKAVVPLKDIESKIKESIFKTSLSFAEPSLRVYSVFS